MWRALAGAALLASGALAACSSFGSSDEAKAPGDAGSDVAVACPDADLTSPRSCGRCGRDCGGGECVDGACAPYRIVQANAPFYATVDGTHVYWTSLVQPALARGTGDVQRAPKLGGGAPQTLMNDPAVFDVAVVNDTAFVTVIHGANRGVYRVPIAGGARAKVTNLMFELAVRDARLYGVRLGPPNDVVEINASSSALRLIGTLGDAGAASEGMAVDATHVYWTNHVDGGSVARMSRDGQGGVEELHSGLLYPRRLTLDDEAIYWTSDFVDKLMRAPKGGGPATSILDAPIHLGTAVVDEDYAYVTVQGAGQVVRVDKRTGLDVRVLKAGLASPVGITQDETAIYFTEFAASPNGAIWRMVK